MNALAPTLAPAPKSGTPLVGLTVNGARVEAEIEPRTHLADFLRERLDLTGTHLGCEHGVCGACTLLVDGEPARGCITFAATCGDAEIVTIEGLDGDEIAAELRAAFNREHALQCGFCTPGMLVAARDLAIRLPEPDEKRIRAGLAGNLCRCTGYVGVVRAIQSVIADRRGRGIAARTPDRRLGPVGAHPSRGAAAPRQAAGARGPAAAAPTATVQDFVPTQSFEQRFEVGFPADQVYALFGDPRAVASCLPGAFVDAQPSPERVEGGIRVKVGPISAAFRGAALIERDEAARSGRILGAGSDGRSGAQGEIRYLVSAGPAPSTSEIAVTVGYALKGPLAQFGRPGLVRDIASRLTADFARNIEARLQGRDADPRAQAAGVNPLRVLGGALVAWLRSALGLDAKGPR